MGEVRVTVRLTNAVDEAPVRRGMLAPDQVRRCDSVRGQRIAEYAGGRTEAVSVTEPLLVELEGRDTLEEALVLGDDVLIGHPGWLSARATTT